MKNAELIKALRECEYCNACSIAVDGDCPFGGRNALEVAAATALEAAEKCIKELEAQNAELVTKCNQLQAQIPKRGECKKLLRNQWINYYECSICGNRFDDAVNYCPNCGARMQTVTDCHTLEEGEHDE